MKKIASAIFVLFCFIYSFTFYSCSDDSIIPGVSGNLEGSWKVDKVWLMNAPDGATGSALMKKALMMYGELNADFVGNMDLNIGAETLQRTQVSINAYSGVQTSFFGNTGYAIASSDQHKIVKTTDGGISWTDLIIPSGTYPGCVSAANAETIFFVNNEIFPRTLYRSTDGGTSWSLMNAALPASPYQNSINRHLRFFDANTGYLQTESLYKTLDGGITWYIIDANFNSGYYDALIQFTDVNTGYLSRVNSTEKRVGITTTGGQTWTSSNIAQDVTELKLLQFINASTGWASVSQLYNQSGLYKTTDGGNTWVRKGKALTGNIFFKDANTGYAISRDGFPLAIKSTDGGTNWKPYFSNRPILAASIEIINGSAAFFDYNGGLWKSTEVIDGTKWTVTGRITNEVIKSITNAPDFDAYAAGEISVSGLNANFTSTVYSQGKSEGYAPGSYTFDGNDLYITLTLPGLESWRVKLKKK
jgi:photosystem II stability/assembly factor-like uncharacterized protein